MIETPEMKAKFEVMLDKARGVHPLRQAQKRLALELGNLPLNAIPLQMAGRTLADEKKRIEGEMVTLREKERDILQELQQFFSALVKDATQPVHGKIPQLLLNRLRLSDLLSEAGKVYTEIEQVEKNWTKELDGLRNVAAQLKNETNESYSLPELPFPTPLVPSPTVQQVVRMRDRSDNIAEMLQMMSKQIG
jgi:hypothetical protein